MGFSMDAVTVKMNFPPNSTVGYSVTDVLVLNHPHDVSLKRLG